MNHTFRRYAHGTTSFHIRYEFYMNVNVLFVCFSILMNWCNFSIKLNDQNDLFGWQKWYEQNDHTITAFFVNAINRRFFPLNFRKLIKSPSNPRWKSMISNYHISSMENTIKIVCHLHKAEWKIAILNKVSNNGFSWDKQSVTRSIFIYTISLIDNFWYFFLYFCSCSG